MRENEKKMNMADDRKSVEAPVLIAAAVFVLLIGFLAWLAVKQPGAVSGIRDLLITLFVFLLFLIGIVLTVLMIILTSRIDGAKVKIDEVISSADGKTEELADKVTEILKSILDPFIEAKSRNSGLKGLFSKKNTEE